MHIHVQCRCVGSCVGVLWPAIAWRISNRRSQRFEAVNTRSCQLLGTPALPLANIGLQRVPGFVGKGLVVALVVGAVGLGACGVRRPAVRADAGERAWRYLPAHHRSDAPHTALDELFHHRVITLHLVPRRPKHLGHHAACAVFCAGRRLLGWLVAPRTHTHRHTRTGIRHHNHSQ